jgi:hypothetical protein
MKQSFRTSNLLSALLIAVMATSAFAGKEVGNVVYVGNRACDGLLYFKLNGAPTGKPACATQPYWIVRDETSAAGKRQHQMIVAAHLSGQTIAVLGANDCARWGDGETVNDLAMCATATLCPAF